jgi:hypothetical protein
MYWSSGRRGWVGEWSQNPCEWNAGFPLSSILARPRTMERQVNNGDQLGCACERWDTRDARKPFTKEKNHTGGISKVVWGTVRRPFLHIWLLDSVVCSVLSRRFPTLYIYRFALFVECVTELMMASYRTAEEENLHPCKDTLIHRQRADTLLHLSSEDRNRRALSDKNASHTRPPIPSSQVWFTITGRS